MRVLACVGLMALCLGLVGCSSFGKKPQGPPNPGNPLPPGPGQPPRPEAAPFGQGPAGMKSILAGQVIDSYNRKPPKATSIEYRLVSSKDNKDSPEAAAAPIQVTADSQGYFTILGLESGKPYQLIARVYEGNKVVMAGTTWATPPNPKVLIRISEDFANGDAPPPPPAPAYPSGKDQTKPKPSAGDARSQNGNSIRRAAELGPPIPGSGITPVQILPPNPTAPAAGKENARPDLSRTINIANPYQPREPPTSSIPPVTTVVPPDNRPSTVAEPAAVPSCILTGNKLENFALNDLDGKTWEFRKHHGRLVLVDFWGTWCGPCLAAIKELNSLHHKYGRYGLEVVGIAYERGALEQQIMNVRAVRSRHQFHYTVLLGSGLEADCPVRDQFKVAAYPTLILLDENGQILWRSEGLQEPQRQQLENLIRQRLGIR